ncbi:MAG: hypothetical protein ACOCWG_01465 [bacterium]
MKFINTYGVAVYKEYEDIPSNSKFPFEVRTIKGIVFSEDDFFIRIKSDFGKIREINKNDLVRFKPKKKGCSQ